LVESLTPTCPEELILVMEVVMGGKPDTHREVMVAEEEELEVMQAMVETLA
jgi:hypothetical protein